jgi:hypothetical protein
MWKANGKTTTLQLFLDSLSPKTEELSLEETMDLSRDRLILELGIIPASSVFCVRGDYFPPLCRVTVYVILDFINFNRDKVARKTEKPGTKLI